MTPATFRETGEALFGPTWQTELARQLDVAVRTVQRWASGERGIPLTLCWELSELCQTRARALLKISKTIGAKTP